MAGAVDLDQINTLPKLVDYLRDHCDWPIEEHRFEDLTYDWDPKELGLKDAAQYESIEIKQLRPLTSDQPWGVFFVNFPKKDLKVTVLRRILGALTIKQRKSANAADRAAWKKNDLLFLSAYGESGHRRLTFAHFQDDPDDPRGVARLDVLGWNPDNTVRRLSQVRQRLTENLHWRGEGESVEHWRKRWTSAFDERPKETITTSKQLASAMAALARNIRDRAVSLLDEESDTGPLTRLHKAFKEALIHDLTPERFADMYAQTITYGLLATTFRRPSGAVTADSVSMMALPTNPFLAETLNDFLHAGGRKGGMDFDELGVNDVVEMLRRANMEAVLRDFDDRNPEQDPVIHFYESFLKEYDPEERIQRGVFYTPRPVVSFIVRSVDEVLRRDFKLEDGLADTATWGEMEKRLPGLKKPGGVRADEPFVRILDPATGTGTFLVEVIDLIYERMSRKWEACGKSKSEIGRLWNEYVPRDLLPRLYAFELMMAPYTIAHMKIGLKLFDTGYRFRSQERARVFLANALEDPKDLDLQLAFVSEALAHEAKVANEAKTEKFTVVIGNPPYKGDSLNPSKDKFGRITDAGKLIQHFFFVDGKPLNERNSKWINNDYIKFLALAEKVINCAGAGAVGYITSNSWLDGQIFRGARASLLASFQSVWVIDLHGNVNRREQNPDGGRDEGVFQISEGTSITVGSKRAGPCIVHRCDLFGTAHRKFEWLQSNSVSDVPVGSYPETPLRLLVAGAVGSDFPYSNYVGLNELLPLNGVGMVTARDGVVVDFDEGPIIQRAALFRDARQTDAALCEALGIPEKKGWNIGEARRALRQERDLDCLIKGVLYRPFDLRKILYHGSLVWRTAWALMRNQIEVKNIAMVTTRQTKDEWGVLVTNAIITHKALSAYDISYLFPLWLAPSATDRRIVPNMALAPVRRMAALTGLSWKGDVKSDGQQSWVSGARGREIAPDSVSDRSDRGDLISSFGPRDVFDWTYAILHSPAYRNAYADLLKVDFARVPLPASKALFQQLVSLGTKLTALHLFDELDEGAVREPKGIRLAGCGAASIEKGFPRWKNGRVLINAERWFEEVPENIWNFHIGGYQVCERWLKDRRIDKLGRPLNESEILHYHRIVTAISETLDLMAEIDRVIDSHGGWPGAFKGMAEVN